jgi:DNA replication protein DnaC
MHDLSTLMHEVLRGIESRQQSRPEPGMNDGSAAAGQSSELIARLRTLPAVPSTWEDLVHARIRSAVNQWSWGDGNLLLLGSTGCGKTVGAAVLARRLLTTAKTERDWRRARGIAFVEAARLAIAREQHGLGQGEAPLVQRCFTASLLILDELGYLDKETGTIEQVVDARNKARRPIVVTSGMQPQELQARYGGATARKLMAAHSNDVLVQVFRQ